MSVAIENVRSAMRRARWWGVVGLGMLFFAPSLHGQDIIIGGQVNPMELSIGQSIPLTTFVQIQRVSVTNPEIADVVVISDREVVLHGLTPGITDFLIWQTDGVQFHYRVRVHSPTDRKQVLLFVRIAEASKDLLRELGVSMLYRWDKLRAGSNQFAFDRVDDAGNLIVNDRGQFATVLSLEHIENLTALLDLAEQSGRFRTLAEPNLIAANGEEASFLAGGELPVPVAQPAAVGGVQAVTIVYREFGIRLNFKPEILSDDLIKLAVAPEVSTLDFGNAIQASGFLIPALRTRRANTTVDLLQGQTLAIAGLLSNEEQKTKVGVPLLKDIPILGFLFSSERFERAETELLVLITPVIFDPLAPPPAPDLPEPLNER
ncbi:MAG: pilus assembly protein N-terminal domain-containing protein [Rhodothermales bacterium]|nr:pilus assembly protein N-terminal domain-containing protein [Rhodothermales bacterium]